MSFPVCEVRVFFKFAQVGVAYEVTTFHTVMILGAGQGIGGEGLDKLQSCGTPRGGGRAQDIDIEAQIVAYPTTAGAAVSQVYCNHIVGLARNDPNGCFNGSVSQV